MNEILVCWNNANDSKLANDVIAYLVRNCELHIRG